MKCAIAPLVLVEILSPQLLLRAADTLIKLLIALPVLRTVEAACAIARKLTQRLVGGDVVLPLEVRVELREARELRHVERVLASNESVCA